MCVHTVCSLILNHAWNILIYFDHPVFARFLTKSKQFLKLVFLQLSPEGRILDEQPHSYPLSSLEDKPHRKQSSSTDTTATTNTTACLRSTSGSVDYQQSQRHLPSSTGSVSLCPLSFSLAGMSR